MLDGQVPAVPEGGEPAAGDGSGNPALSMTSDAVRNSPEFQALAKQNRLLARQKGTAEAAAVAARSEAETARQAAEAERNAALVQQLTATLGADGIAAYNEIAELSATDPVAAAVRLAEFAKAGAGQTPPAQAPGATVTPAAQAGEGTVANAAQAQTPPPPSQGADGGQPLGMASTGEDQNAIIASLEKTYSDVVVRNQNFATRNRVTMKDRAAAMIAYVGAAYLKAGAKPR